MFIFISVATAFAIFTLITWKAGLVLNAEQERARRAFGDNSIGSGTAGGYKNKCRHIAEWCKAEFPDLMTGPEKEGFTFDWVKICAAADEGQTSLASRLFESFASSIKRRSGDLSIPYSKSSMLGYRSAFKKLCGKCGYSLPSDWVDFTKGVLKTVGKIYTRKKAEGIVEDQAKIPLSFYQYYEICKYLWHQGDIESKALLCFAQAQWNITCRADNIERLRITHMKTFDDSVQVILYITKTGQEGEHAEPRYIYFNPLGIEEDTPGLDTRYIDFGLGLSSYFLTHHDRRSETELFYPGAAQTLRARLKVILEENHELFGIDKEDVKRINFHSLRKGAGTHCTSGSIAGPSAISVGIRMQHSMSTQGTYLQFEHAGDQFVGRTLAGFNQNSVSLFLI